MSCTLLRPYALTSIRARQRQQSGFALSSRSLHMAEPGLSDVVQRRLGSFGFPLKNTTVVYQHIGRKTNMNVKIHCFTAFFRQH